MTATTSTLSVRIIIEDDKLASSDSTTSVTPINTESTTAVIMSMTAASSTATVSSESETRTGSTKRQNRKKKKEASTSGRGKVNRCWPGKQIHDYIRIGLKVNI